MDEKELIRKRFIAERRIGETQPEYEKRIPLEDFHHKVIGDPIISEETFNRIIRESVEEYNIIWQDKKLHEIFKPYLDVHGYLMEGVDIDEIQKTVTYNPKHENYVSTELASNPTQNHGFDNGIDVWSVFKRNKLDRRDQDGNPLLYALKCENGWRFKSNADRTKILNQISLIVNKFSSGGQYNPTIVIPSGSQLNIIFARIVKEQMPNTTIVNDIITKMGAEEVYDDVTGFNTPFRKKYNTDKSFLAAIKKLRIYITRMNEKRNGMFTYHFIDDNEMRSVIEQTLKLSDDCLKYGENINGKDILIIDDSISQGITANYAIKLIKKTFAPNRITVLTLFSKL